MRLIFLTLLALPSFSFSLKGQSQTINLAGVVLDSATLQPLPYVAIQIKNKSIGLSTKDDGTFSIETSISDTLVFTRLGHKPLLFSARKNQNELRIILAEDARMLKDVTVYGDYNIDGVDDWKKNLPPNTQVKLKNQPLEPEPGSVATFGPGLTIGIGGKDKTKNKRDELSKTEVYRKTITSPEVKKQVMELYGISEETFNTKLVRFNLQYPEAPYIESEKEIINLLIQFFALKD